MSDCPDGLIRDELPGYVLGTLAPAEHARIDAHVQSCAECAAEVALLRSVGAAYPAPAVNSRRVAANVQAQLAGVAMQPSVRRGWSFRGSFTVWQAAAALAVIAVGGLALWKMREAVSEVPAAPTTVQATPGGNAPTKRAGSTSTREIALASRGAQTAHEVSFGGGLSDLTDAQLKSLLASLDAIEASPSSDPESIAKPILPDRTDPNGGRQR